ncbi:MAG TPA: hypothetical protein VGL91_02110, partial [Acidobacteriota bacterium]
MSGTLIFVTLLNCPRNEVPMPGACRLFWTLTCLFLFAIALWADDSSSSSTATAPATPPKAKTEVVEDNIHGHKIADPYRWLENSQASDTQQYVHDELAYTRSILDPLPGRAQTHQRLTQLLSIGTIGTPQLGGNFYFYTRREGTQNQPVLFVREGINGEDRTLLDVNQLAADGTVALDWWFPSEDGKYVAYGTSASGSEESTLKVIETATGKQLPDTIERTRFASVAWKKDNSAFFYSRHPKKGDVPSGEEVYHVKIFYHVMGTDPAKDPLIFGEGRKAQDIPGVQLADDDDRWLLITVFQGWAKSEMYLQDLKAGTPPVEITSGKDFLYSGEVYQNKLYITTNEDAPRSRVLVVDAANPKRENWKEIVPQSDAVLQNTAIVGGKLGAQYEKNASSLLKLFQLDGKFIDDIPLPAIGTVSGTGSKWNRQEIFFGFQSFTIPPSIYHYDLSSRKTNLWDKVNAPGIDPSAYEVNQVWYTSKDGTKVP